MNAEEKKEVSSLELFFDLVFVFAISQLSIHFLHHFSWHGALETIVLMLPIYMVWSYTSWEATLSSVQHSSTRWMLIAVMLTGLFMNASISWAFGKNPFAFIIPFLSIQFGRTFWTIFYSIHRIEHGSKTAYRSQYYKILLWLCLSAPFWITGGFTTNENRFTWWLVASAIDLTGTFLAHPIPGKWLESTNLQFDADHMQERCRLFLIIALGESLLTTGTAVTKVSLTPMVTVTAMFAFAGTVALWMLAFGKVDSLIQNMISQTNNPVRASRYSMNVLMVMVAALIAVAVSNEEVLLSPRESTSVLLSILMTGGPLVYLIAHAWYSKVELKMEPRIQYIGIIAMFALSLTILTVESWIALILVNFTLIILAVIHESNKKGSYE
jgi:low temperature requirement protein LtrA